MNDEDCSLLKELCEEFCYEWQNGRTPVVAEWCRTLPQDRRIPFLCRLIALDQQFRLRKRLPLMSLSDYASAVGVDTAELAAAWADSGMDRGDEPQEAARDIDTATANDTAPQGRAAGAAGAAPDGNAKIGTQRVIGGCVLVEEIARGGMGVVYKAWQPQVKRYVAVKLMHPSMDAQESFERQFQIEAEASGRLDHPGIVRVIDADIEDGRPYIVMEFVDGSTLQHRIQQGLLPNSQTARLALQIAEAIAYAHGRGVIHRDLKPANILLDRDDTVRVTDFGLARLEYDAQAITRTGLIIGTPMYMSPEQARGDVRTISALSDVYALGAIIYHCLTDRPPFHAPSHERVLDLVIGQPPIRPRSLNREVDLELEIICLRCLEKNPSDRPSSAQFVADELRRYLDRRPIQLRPVGKLKRFYRWWQRDPRQVLTYAATGFLLVMVLTGLPLMMWLWSNLKLAQSEQDLAESEIARAHEAEMAEREKNDANQHFTFVLQAETERIERKPGWTWRVIDLISQAAGIPLESVNWYRLRSLVADALTSIDVRPRETVFTQQPCEFMALSPGGKMLAAPERRGFPVVRIPVFETAPDSANRFEQLLDPPPVKWTVNAKMDHTLTPWTGRGTLNPGFSAICFSPDGTRLAATCRNGVIIVFDVTQQHASRVQTLEFDDRDLDFVFYTSDGRYLVVYYGGHMLRTIDLHAESIVAEIHGHFLGLCMLSNDTVLVPHLKDGAHQIDLLDAQTLTSAGDVAELSDFVGHHSVGPSDLLVSSSILQLTLVDGRTLTPGMTMQADSRAAIDVSRRYTGRNDLSLVAAGYDPGMVRLWDGLSGWHVTDIPTGGARIPFLVSHDDADELLVLSAGELMAWQTRCPGAVPEDVGTVTDRLPLTDCLTPGVLMVDHFDLSPDGSEIALHTNDYLFAQPHPFDSVHRWQVRRLDVQSRKLLGNWVYCVLNEKSHVVQRAITRGLTYAGREPTLYLASGLPNGIFRLSGNGFDPLDGSLAPVIRCPVADVAPELARWTIPPFTEFVCQHVRLAVECQLPRSLHPVTESLTLRFSAGDTVLETVARHQHLAEPGWYLLELDAIPTEHFSAPCEVTLQLTSRDLQLNAGESSGETTVQVREAYAFPQSTYTRQNFTIGPMTGLDDGTCICITDDNHLKFWADGALEPDREWFDRPNDAPGLRCVDARANAVLTGTRFGNGFLLDTDANGQRIHGSLLDEGAENGRSITCGVLSSRGTIGIFGHMDGSLTCYPLHAPEGAGRLTPSADPIMAAPHDTKVTAVATNADGTLIASGSDSGQLSLHERTDSGLQPWFSLSLLTSAVRQLEFSPDGTRLYILCNRERGVRVLNLDVLESHFEAAGLESDTQNTNLLARGQSAKRAELPRP